VVVAAVAPTLSARRLGRPTRRVPDGTRSSSAKERVDVVEVSAGESPGQGQFRAVYEEMLVLQQDGPVEPGWTCLRSPLFRLHVAESAIARTTRSPAACSPPRQKLV